MTETAQFSLPLVMPAQAQKHVTVNEALARLDAAAQLRIASFGETEAPGGAADGSCFSVPAGAGGAWMGQGGKLAIAANGGWVFLTPKVGWRAWDIAGGRNRIFNGTAWVADAVAVTSGGAATLLRIAEFDHAIDGGGSSTGPTIPGGAQVFGITGRVTAAITGTLGSWRLGVSGAADRYGTGLGLAKNSYVRGISGSPVTYYSDTVLVLTAEGGLFASGSVRLCIHYLELLPPRPV
jgi:hypothetical protein